LIFYILKTSWSLISHSVDQSLHSHFNSF